MLSGEIREALIQSGFPLIEPEAVAQAVLGCVLGQSTGQAIVPDPAAIGRALR